MCFSASSLLNGVKEDDKIRNLSLFVFKPPALCRLDDNVKEDYNKKCRKKGISQMPGYLGNFSLFVFKPQACWRPKDNVEEADKIINLSLFVFYPRSRWRLENNVEEDDKIIQALGTSKNKFQV